MPWTGICGRLVGACGAAFLTLVAGAAPVASAESLHAGYLRADRIQVAHFAAIESGRLGISAVPIAVIDQRRVTGTVNGETIEGAAVTEGFDASGGATGPETRCTTTFAAAAHRTAVDLAADAAHEVFHCLSGRLAGTLATFNAHRAWLLEGAATWVESDLVDRDPFSGDEWIAYFNTPDRSLFARAYDAIGFFGHLAAAGISPWSRFAAMFSAPSEAAAYAASGAGTPAALDTEASAFFGAPELGDAWTAYHQGDPIADGNVPRTHQVAQTVAVTNGHTRTLTVQPYADGIFRLRAVAPVTMLQVSGGGEVRLHSTEGPELDRQHVISLTLCRDGAICRCPSGPVSEARRFELGDLAISSGPSVESVTVTASCNLPPRPCTALDLDSAFPPPSGDYEPDLVQTSSGSGNEGLVSGSVCTVHADLLPKFQNPFPEQALGLYDVLTYASSEDAHRALAQIAQKVFPSGTSPADAGEEAFTSPGGGGVRVDNDVFYFLWFPKSPADEAVSQVDVLRSVAAVLDS